MDAISALSGIASAFGLSGSAGLNAYIPLLIVALAGRFPNDDPLLSLAEPYNVITSWWAIGLLVVLLAVEITVDKVPAIDSINDVIQTFVRPTAGALLFAANADVITDLNPILALVAGLLLAGGVHATKAVARPAVTTTTAGTGNWFISLVEDVVAFFLSVLSVLLPILALMLLFGLIIGVIWLVRRRRGRELAYE
ncbi:MAG: DUF4126 domain-containing protein [Candidatus Promineifilaceae bacterium]|nr:DUF4126 domain-containing protein [Candidatus Promineifilaceae bacterium]